MDYPRRIKIFDLTYTVEYVDKPSDVDIHRRESLFGQVDFWTRTIRIYAKDRSEADIWQTLWHEILHVIAEKLHIEAEAGALHNQEDVIDLLATGINCVVFDNSLYRAEKTLVEHHAGGEFEQKISDHLHAAFLGSI